MEMHAGLHSLHRESGVRESNVCNEAGEQVTSSVPDVGQRYQTHFKLEWHSVERIPPPRPTVLVNSIKIDPISNFVAMYHSKFQTTINY